MSNNFNRGLSDKLMDDLLGGPSAKVLEACVAAGLDVRLRDNYVSFYSYGRCLGKLLGRSTKTAKLEVHRAYLTGERIGAYRGRGSGYHRWFSVDDGFAAAYAESLPQLIKDADLYVKSEESIESQLLKDNSSSTPIRCFDRQVALPGEKGRLDIVGYRSDPPAFVAIEVKRYPDPSIQRVPEQLHSYLGILDPDRDGLREDIAESYSLVCKQLCTLNLPAPDPLLILPGIPVEGLVIVASYNENSDLLPRAHESAAEFDRPIYLWQPGGDDLTIPDASEWTLMGE